MTLSKIVNEPPPVPTRRVFEFRIAPLTVESTEAPHVSCMHFIGSVLEAMNSFFRGEFKEWAFQERISRELVGVKFEEI